MPGSEVGGESWQWNCHIHRGGCEPGEDGHLGDELGVARPGRRQWERSPWSKEQAPQRKELWKRVASRSSRRISDARV